MVIELDMAVDGMNAGDLWARNSAALYTFSLDRARQKINYSCRSSSAVEGREKLSGPCQQGWPHAIAHYLDEIHSLR